MLQSARFWLALTLLLVAMLVVLVVVRFVCKPRNCNNRPIHIPPIAKVCSPCTKRDEFPRVAFRQVATTAATATATAAPSPAPFSETEPPSQPIHRTWRSIRINIPGFGTVGSLPSFSQLAHGGVAGVQELLGLHRRDGGAQLEELDKDENEVRKSSQNSIAEWARRRQRDLGHWNAKSITVSGLFRENATGMAASMTTTAGRITYLDAEDETTNKGEVVVLLHGFTADKDSWTFLAPHLSRERHRLIAPDLPGFGESTRLPNASYDIRSQAARIIMFLDALKIVKPVHLVGSSMGGNIAARITLDHPGRVRSLALLGALGVLPPVPSAVQRALEAGEHNPLISRTQDEFNQMLKLVFATPPFPLQNSLVRKYLGEQAIADSTFNLKIYADLQQQPDWLSSQDLAEIVAPTLIIWGEVDRIIDVSAVTLWRKIPGSRAVILRGIGHVPPVEAPRETAKELAAFWN